MAKAPSSHLASYNHSMPRALVIVLCILGCLGLLVAVTAIWIQANLNDVDRFGRLAAEAIRSPELSGEVAHALWRSLEARYFSTVPLTADDVEPTIAAALRGEGARGLVTRMARALNLALTATPPVDWGIVLGDDYPLVAQAILDIEPDLLPLFPGEDEVGVVTLAKADEMPHLGGWADSLPLLVVIAGVAGGILLAVGVYAADPRWRAVRAAGLTLAFAAVLLLAFEFLAPEALRRQVEDGVAGRVASQALFAMTGGLRWQTGIVAAVGALTAAAGALAGAPRPPRAE